MEKKNDKGKELGLTIAIIVGAVLVFPLLVFSIPFLILFRIIKKPKIYAAVAIISIIFFVLTLIYSPSSYFALYGILPFEWLHKLSNKHHLRLNTTSYALYVTGGIFISYILNIAINYYRSKKITSKEEHRESYLESSKYEKVKGDRYDLATKEQRKWRKSGDKEKLLVGIDEKGKPTFIDFKELNQHHFVIATTGGGKTIYLLGIVEYALMKNYPIVFIDGKGSTESIEEVRTLCKRYGQDLKVFSDTNQLTYNPLKYGGATTIKDKLEQLVATESDYYTDISNSLVQALIQFIDEYGFKRDLWTFAKYLEPEEIKKVLNDDVIEIELIEESPEVEKSKETFSSFLDDVEKEPQNAPIAIKQKQYKKVRSERAEKYYERFFSRYKHEEDGEMYLFKNASSVRTQIYLLLDSELGHLFEEKEDGLDLVRLSEQKEALFISFDGLIYDKFLKTISRFVILDLNYLVSYRNRQMKKDEPLLAIYDEFSAYANEKIVDTINKSRSGGFHCVIATQTLSDLKKVDPELVNQIIGNTNTYAFGQTNDPEGVEYMANTLGTYKDIDTTVVTERQEGRLKRIDLKGDKGTIRKVQKYKITPDEIRDLRQGMFVIARKAAKEKHEPKIIYARNPLNE